MHQGGRLQDWFFALTLHEIDGQGGEGHGKSAGASIEGGRIAADPCEKKLRRIRDLRVHNSCFGVAQKKFSHRVTVFAVVSRMEFRERYFPDNFQGESYK